MYMQDSLQGIEKPVPGIDEQANTFRYRVNDPSRYSDFRVTKNQFGSGINAVWGITNSGDAELQSIQFKKKKFPSTESVRNWLSSHSDVVSDNRHQRRGNVVERSFLALNYNTPDWSAEKPFPYLTSEGYVDTQKVVSDINLRNNPNYYNNFGKAEDPSAVTNDRKLKQIPASNLNMQVFADIPQRIQQYIQTAHEGK